MKKINVAVIGLGYWGPNVLRNLSQVSGVEIKYGCDINEAQLQKLLKNYPNTKPITNYKSILSDKKIDAISIATPLSTHFRIAKDALLAGKHVLLEKPFTRTTEEAQELISIAKRGKLVLMAGHTFVYSKSIEKIKKIVSKGDLGKIYYYDSERVNLGIYQNDADVIWDLAVHDLSILNYILSAKPISVNVIGSNFLNSKVIDDAHIFLKYHSNIICHIHVSWLSPVKLRNIVLAGSKRMICYNDIEPSEKIKIYDKGLQIPARKITPFSPVYRSGNVVMPNIPQREALLDEVKHFIKCVRNNDKPITDGQSALETIKILEACAKSINNNTEVKLI